MKAGHTDCQFSIQLSYQFIRSAKLSLLKRVYFDVVSADTACKLFMHAFFSVQFWELTRIPRDSSPRQVRAKFGKVKQFKIQKVWGDSSFQEKFVHHEREEIYYWFVCPEWWKKEEGYFCTCKGKMSNNTAGCSYTCSNTFP